MNQAKEKPQMIIEIASKLFTRYGYNKTSLEEVAAEAQIAKGTIYYYFSNKEDLFMSVVDNQANQFIGKLQNRIESVNGFENKLKEFLLTPLGLVKDNILVLMEGINNIPFTYRKRFQSFREDHRRLMLNMLLEILEIGKQEGLLALDIPAKRLADILNDWFITGYRNFSEPDLEVTIKLIERDHELLTNIILYGIVKRGI